MKSRFERAEAAFHAILEAKPENREAFLPVVCGSDPALMKEVRKLLAAHEQSEGHLDAPVSPAIEAEMARLKPEEAGDFIGHYKLLQQIGEGGFGTVWMAEQQQPVKRRVALKIIKLGMDTKEVVARFEQERQALAMMDHPNIAKVFDAGATPTGRPYFVMELVRGVKLTQYCDDLSLSTVERIQLFVHVCHAIQHAHQKGIIHRDLKPSNVLVTINDGIPVPKVIDFGVAKATQGRLSALTLFTRFEQMVGTPLYMSPEQAEMTSLDIDTRSDIYSLGVMLYELLTGRTPIDETTLARIGLDEVRRVIREVDPLRPSMRVRTLDDQERTITAKRHHVDPSKLGSMLKGDLDWIVMKCLEKDRKRRYDTANGLAQDLQRHLTHQLITARPPTTAYLLSKFIRRNKPAVAGAAAIFASLAIGFVVSVWQAKRANHEAIQRLSEAERANTALNDLRATAPMFLTEAEALVARGKFDEAIRKLEYASKLRPDSPDYLVAKGNLLQSQLRLREATECYRAALEIRPDHPTALENAELCEELEAAPKDAQGKLSRESLAGLHARMQAERRSPAEQLSLARLLGEEKDLLLSHWTERLRHLPISPERPLKERLNWGNTGRLSLDLSGTPIGDLSPLEGMPLGQLDLRGCRSVTSLEPLRNMPLRTLVLADTGVTDLSPLREISTLVWLDLRKAPVSDLRPLQGLQLTRLELSNPGINDLSPLRGMPLETFTAEHTRIASLSPLAGMPLRDVKLDGVPVSDLDVLIGMPLRGLYLRGSDVRDLGILRGMPLQRLWLIQCRLARNYAALGDIQTLELLQLPETYRQLPAREIEAIAALQSHPRLKQIAADVAEGGVPDAIGIKEEFWRQWKIEAEIVKPLREAGIPFQLRPVLGSRTFDLTIENPRFTDLDMIKGAPLSRLKLKKTGVTDLRPLKGMPLRFIDLWDSPVSSLDGLQDLPLEHVNLMGTQVADVSAVCGPALELLWCDGAPLRDITPLARCKSLRSLSLAVTSVDDIAPLRGLPLTLLRLEGSSVRDLSALHGMVSLEKLVLPEVSEKLDFLRELPRLRKLGYGYDACISPENFFKQSGFFTAIAQMRASGRAPFIQADENGSWHVSFKDAGLQDLAPLRGARISVLNLTGTTVTDLSPLVGMPLVELNLTRTAVTNFEPLRELNLKILNLDGTQIEDLRPLLALPLRELHLAECTRITDLAPLANLTSLVQLKLPPTRTGIEALRQHPKLSTLILDGAGANDVKIPVADFWLDWNIERPLRKIGAFKAGVVTKELDGTYAINLNRASIDRLPSFSSTAGISKLSFEHTAVHDLAPLSGLNLKFLDCDSTKISDLTLLKGQPLQSLSINSTRVTDLSALRGMPLREFFARDTKIVDVSPLASIASLEWVMLPPFAQNVEVLRPHQRIKRLSFDQDDIASRLELTAAEFWQAWDRGSRMPIELTSRAGKYQEVARSISSQRPLRTGHREALRRLVLNANHAAAGDQDVFRAECAHIVERFGSTTDLYEAERAAKACLVAPNAALPKEAIDRWLRIASPMKENSLRLYWEFTNGLAAYRFQRWDEVAPAMRKLADQEKSKDVIIAAIQACVALGEAGAGREENARKYAQAARMLIDPQWPKGELVNNWYDWLIASLILKEAEQILAQTSSGEDSIEQPR
jgi:serine/threonine protein kinase/Leucine-rich repeat (LRR) protein